MDYKKQCLQNIEDIERDHKGQRFLNLFLIND